MGANGQCAMNATDAKDLDREFEPARDAGFVQQFWGDYGLRIVELLQALDIYDLENGLEDVGEATLVRHPRVERMLAAFKPRSNAAAGTLSLGATTGCLPFSG